MGDWAGVGGARLDWPRHVDGDGVADEALHGHLRARDSGSLAGACLERYKLVMEGASDGRSW